MERDEIGVAPGTYLRRICEKRTACRVAVGKPEGRNNLEERGIGGRIILEWIIK